MTTFKNFLLEAPKFDLEQFKKDCAPFLEQLAKVPKDHNGTPLLFHGSKFASSDWTIRDWRERVGPRDTAPEMHDMFNKELVNVVGAPIRNWLFTTTDYSTAKLYSGARSPHAIFPIGKFELVCISKENNELYAHDLMTWLDVLTGRFATDNDIPRTQARIMAAKHITNRFKFMKWIKNDLVAAMTNDGIEIMLKCKSFYEFNFTGDTLHRDVQPFLNTL